MTQAKTLDYWQNMRIAMEAAGATSSAIYKRALAISQGLQNPFLIRGSHLGWWRFQDFYAT